MILFHKIQQVNVLCKILKYSYKYVRIKDKSKLNPENGIPKRSWNRLSYFKEDYVHVERKENAKYFLTRTLKTIAENNGLWIQTFLTV
jgi:hypothetical protein